MISLISATHPVSHAMIFRMDQEFVLDSELIALDTCFPEDAEFCVAKSMEMQGVKLLSSFDATDLFQVGSIYALYPWNNPKGYFFALYFPLAPIVRENRFNEPLTMMVGLIIDRSYAPITTLVLDNIYSIMERKLSTIIELLSKTLSMPQQNPEGRTVSPHELLLKCALKEVRDETFELIESWMSNFGLDV